MLHSGSSARPTSGSFSQCSSAFASWRKGAYPGWMSSSSSILWARATRR